MRSEIAPTFANVHHQAHHTIELLGNLSPGQAALPVIANQARGQGWVNELHKITGTKPLRRHYNTSQRPPLTTGSTVAGTKPLHRHCNMQLASH